MMIEGPGRLFTIANLQGAIAIPATIPGTQYHAVAPTIREYVCLSVTRMAIGHATGIV